MPLPGNNGGADVRGNGDVLNKTFAPRNRGEGGWKGKLQGSNQGAKNSTEGAINKENAQICFSHQKEHNTEILMSSGRKKQI